MRHSKNQGLDRIVHKIRFERLNDRMVQKIRLGRLKDRIRLERLNHRIDMIRYCIGMIE